MVADEADAQEAIKRSGARRGEVWTPGEIELVACIEEQAIRDEIAAFKRNLEGSLSAEAVGERKATGKRPCYSLPKTQEDFLGHEVSSTCSEVDFAPLVFSGACFD